MYIFSMKTCIPQSLLWLQLMYETHGGGLRGHFREKNTIKQLEERYFWLQLKWDATKHVLRYPMCQECKRESQKHGIVFTVRCVHWLHAGTSMDTNMMQFDIRHCGSFRRWHILLPIERQMMPTYRSVVLQRDHPPTWAAPGDYVGSRFRVLVTFLVRNLEAVRHYIEVQ